MLVQRCVWSTCRESTTSGENIVGFRQLHSNQAFGGGNTKPLGPVAFLHPLTLRAILLLCAIQESSVWGRAAVQRSVVDVITTSADLGNLSTWLRRQVQICAFGPCALLLATRYPLPPSSTLPPCSKRKCRHRRCSQKPQQATKALTKEAKRVKTFLLQQAIRKSKAAAEKKGLKAAKKAAERDGPPKAPSGDAAITTATTSIAKAGSAVCAEVHRGEDEEHKEEEHKEEEQEGEATPSSVDDDASGGVVASSQDVLLIKVK